MEFNLYDRKFKLVDDELYSFYKRGGKNQIEKWYQIKLTLRKDGYKAFGFKLDGKRKTLLFHRAVYYANNPTWNFYDISMENYYADSFFKYDNDFKKKIETFL